MFPQFDGLALFI